MPLLLLGLLGKFKAFWAGKKGPSVLQPFYDFKKQLYKDQVISTTTGIVFTTGDEQKTVITQLF